jgi:hypothetical protein
MRIERRLNGPRRTHERKVDVEVTGGSNSAIDNVRRRMIATHCVNGNNHSAILRLMIWRFHLRIRDFLSIGDLSAPE